MYNLEIRFTNLTELPELPNYLTCLHCSINKLTQLPKLPNELFMLQCSCNKLTQLPKLPDSLEFLDCQVNKLTCLPKLPRKIKSLNRISSNYTPSWYIGFYYSYKGEDQLNKVREKIINCSRVKKLIQKF